MDRTTAKIVRKKGLPPQAQFSVYTKLASVVVVVGLDGYDYKYYTRNNKWDSTIGKNVHLAMNGPIMLSFEDMEKFLQLVKEGIEQAKETLKSLT